MGIPTTVDTDIDARIARRLKSLRGERGWSLEMLARQSGVSRATLSRLEHGEVSPTASVLGRLCAAYGITLSRLMHLVEESFEPLLSREGQPVWTDPETGFCRRSISPPSGALSGEALEATLQPATDIGYDRPPTPGLEHHLFLIDGALTVDIEGQTHYLRPGDCLRYRLFGESRFTTPEDSGAHYVLFMV